MEVLRAPGEGCAFKELQGFGWAAPHLNQTPGTNDPQNNRGGQWREQYRGEGENGPVLLGRNGSTPDSGFYLHTPLRLSLVNFGSPTPKMPNPLVVLRTLFNGNVVSKGYVPESGRINGTPPGF